MTRTSLRPASLGEFVGKRELKESLAVYIGAAKAAGRTLDHILLYGPAGTGKTSLAMIVASEMGARLKFQQGPNFRVPADIISVLSSLGAGDMLLIDEIHAMNRQCVELLYSAMEDGKMDVTIGKELNAKTIRMDVAPFTLIGATNLLGEIPDALEGRFGIVYKIGLYEDEEIAQIVKNSAQRLKVAVKPRQIDLIAANAKGVPRAANRILRRFADYLAVRTDNPSAALAALGVTETGLSAVDLRYLDALHRAKGQPLGAKTLAASVEEDIATLEQKVEPYLIKSGYVAKTPRGRTLTAEGSVVLQKAR